MLRKLRMYYFIHSIRSDWNNGNAHFQRGLVRALGKLGHKVTCLEAEVNWSFENLQSEAMGREAVEQFFRTYPSIDVVLYREKNEMRNILRDADIVVVHEWTPPEIVSGILDIRDEMGFRAIFHDTHHRASSTPEQIQEMQVARFDGVLAFGNALREIYRTRFGMNRVWTLHEAADTTVFQPAAGEKSADLVWVGNWGDGERSEELRRFLMRPVVRIPDIQATVYGVRYPKEGLQALDAAGIEFKGYLPNLASVEVYQKARLTIHVPRHQYRDAMAGIPTIRVFEALACGIPLISAPWNDCEELFRPEDFLFVTDTEQMVSAIEYLLSHPKKAQEMAERGLATVCAHHTCDHRAEQLTEICEEVLAA